MKNTTLPLNNKFKYKEYYGKSCKHNAGNKQQENE